MGGTVDAEHLLRTLPPLPHSSSCISSGSGLADCRAFLSDAPASHHCQRNCETAGSLRSLGVPRIIATADPSATFSPSFLFPVQPVIGRTCSRVFLSGRRKVSATVTRGPLSIRGRSNGPLGVY